MKICLACSAGGHLSQMQELTDAIAGKTYFWVTYQSEASKDLENAYFINYRVGYIKERITWLKTVFIAFKILLKEKPDVIISIGGGEIAVPFCYAGKLMGARIIFIESLARITTASAAGKLIYPVANLFLVQWKPLLKQYGNRAQYWGSVI